MYNGKVMSDKSCTFSYKSNACKFVHPADSSPQSSLNVFKDTSFSRDTVDLESLSTLGCVFSVLLKTIA